MVCYRINLEMTFRFDCVEMKMKIRAWIKNDQSQRNSKNNANLDLPLRLFLKKIFLFPSFSFFFSLVLFPRSDLFVFLCMFLST